MDWVLIKDIALVTLEFVKVLAWPSVVLIALCVFGRTIKTTLGRLLSFEANGYKALLAELEVKAEKIDRDLKLKSRWWQFWRHQKPRAPEPAAPSDGTASKGDESKPGETSETIPANKDSGSETKSETDLTLLTQDALIGEMVRRWAELEADTLAVHQRVFAGSGGSDRPYRRPSNVVAAVNDLRREKLVAGSTLDTFKEAQQLRNQVVHGQRDLTNSERETFLRLIYKLMTVVRSWQDGLL